MVPDNQESPDGSIKKEEEFFEFVSKLRKELSSSCPPKLRSIMRFSLFGILLLSFNIMNLSYCSRFDFKYPLVEIITPLVNMKDLPTSSYSLYTKQNYTFDNDFLTEILKDVYLRHEQEYLHSMSNRTIIVQPSITWDIERIIIQLREGTYDFESKKLIFSNLTVIDQIVEESPRSTAIFNLKIPSKSSNGFFQQRFLRQIIGTLFYFSEKSKISKGIDLLQKLLFFADVANVSILVSAMVLFLTSVPMVLVQKKTTYMKLILESLPFVLILTNFGFSLFNTVVWIIISYSFPYWKSVSFVIFYFFQSLVTVVIIFKLFLRNTQDDNQKLLSALPSVFASDSSYPSVTTQNDSPDAMHSFEIEPQSKPYSNRIRIPYTAAAPTNTSAARDTDDIIRRCATAPARSECIDVVEPLRASFDTLDIRSLTRRRTASRFTEELD